MAADKTIILKEPPTAEYLAEQIEEHIPESEIRGIRVVCSPGVYADICALSMMGYSTRPDHTISKNVIAVKLGTKDRLSFVIKQNEDALALPAKNESLSISEYKWRSGWVSPKAPARVVGQHLEKLQDKCGTITPEIVIEDAKDEASPIHPFFEWDDSKAATQWRIEQARQIIKEIVVEIKREDSGEVISVRAFMSVDDEDKSAQKPKGGKYTSIRHAITDSEARASILRAAIRDLMTFQAKYQNVRELARLFQAIESTVSKFQEMLCDSNVAGVLDD